MNDELAEKAHNLLLGAGTTLALAESATAGLIAQRLSNFAGSSQYLRLGIVAYAVEAKENVLGLDPSMIEEKGVVSEEVARTMAEQVRKILNSDIGVSITGIAGPGGATDTYPVGTAFIALSYAGGIEWKRVEAKGDRRANKQVFATEVLRLLVDHLQ